MKNKFKNYYGLKRYLSVVAKNNNHDINFDNYSGLEFIYNYLNLHRDKISYNFNFSEWIKLSATNDINELKRISEIGLSINDSNKFNEDIIYKFGLKAFAISNVDKDTICTYTRPTMSTNIGCYFIYDNDGILVYIGKSTSDLLTRACVSALQRVLGDFSKIELLEFNTKAETNIFEIYYISKLKPKFNSESNTKDILPFDLPDTSISRKCISSIEKKVFDSKGSPEFISYSKESSDCGYIVFEKSKGHAYRPIIPLT